jgi:hypothetical protein
MHPATPEIDKNINRTFNAKVKVTPQKHSHRYDGHVRRGLLAANLLYAHIQFYAKGSRPGGYAVLDIGN